MNATNYKLVEAAQTAPWLYVSTSCVLKLSSGDVSAGSAATGFTVQAGVTTECTITNKLQTGTLTVIKHVINDNGGTAAAGDFTMFLGTGNPSHSGSEAGVTTTLNSGTAFAVTESSVAGYTGTVGTGAGDTCSGTMVDAATYVCHVTNDDNAPSLVLNKIVSNTHGGTKVESAWTLTANGGAAGTLSGPGTSGSSDVVSGTGFNKGTYALSETLNAQAPGIGTYTASAWSCVKNGGQAVTGSSITLDLGDSAVCTITNSDTLASPSGTTVQKVVLHDSISIPGIRNGAGNQNAATATFRLYTDNQCSVAVLVGQAQTAYAEPVTLSYGSVANGVTTGSAATSVGVTVMQPKSQPTFYWTVQYSGDSFNSGFTTGCGIETTTLAIQVVSVGR